MDSRSEQPSRSSWRVAATLAVVVAWLVVGAHGAPGVRAEPPEGNHCLLPSGVDLNAFYGVSEQIVNPVCTQVGAGEQWTVAIPWIMSNAFDFVPEGFVPAGTPRSRTFSRSSSG